MLLGEVYKLKKDLTKTLSGELMKCKKVGYGNNGEKKLL